MNEWDDRDLADVLWKYGELRESRRLARAIVASRPLSSTTELAKVISTAIPGPPKVVTKRMARVFQVCKHPLDACQPLVAIPNPQAATLIRPCELKSTPSYESWRKRSPLPPRLSALVADLLSCRTTRLKYVDRSRDQALPLNH